MTVFALELLFAKDPNAPLKEEVVLLTQATDMICRPLGLSGTPKLTVDYESKETEIIVKLEFGSTLEVDDAKEKIEKLFRESNLNGSWEISIEVDDEATDVM